MNFEKDNILKKLGDYLDTLFKKPDETPEVQNAEESKEDLACKPKNKKKFAVEDFPVGQPLPDGEYELDGCIVVLKGGLVESCTPIEEELPEEKPVEQPAQAAEVKQNSDVEAKLQKEFDEKLKAQKEAFDIELQKLINSNKSGIVQGPIVVEEPSKIYSAKEIAIKNVSK